MLGETLGAGALKNLLGQAKDAGQSKENPELRAERDSLLRCLAERKGQLSELEDHVARLYDMKTLLMALITDFQELGQLHFVQDLSVLREPHYDAKALLSVVRTGIGNFMIEHQRLGSKFELMFSRNLFPITEQLRIKSEKLLEERKNLGLVLKQTTQKQRFIKLLSQEKENIIQTILMKRATLGRRYDKYSEKCEELNGQMKQAYANHSEANDFLSVQNTDELTIRQQCEERLNAQSRQASEHAKLVATVQNLKKELAIESHNHNQTHSALDKAKAELVRLTRSVDSYSGNLKTRELLNDEVENKRLRSVARIELSDFEERLAAVRKKGEEWAKQISTLTASVSEVDVRISATEQRLQSQMMKVPDFAQLHMVLDQELVRCKNYKDFVTRRRYFLDEIRERAHYWEVQEIEDSKERMRALAAVMPLESDKNEQTDKLEVGAILEANRKQIRALEELLGDNI
jgi:hypothetical protein